MKSLSMECAKPVADLALKRLNISKYMGEPSLHYQKHGAGIPPDLSVGMRLAP